MYYNQSDTKCKREVLPIIADTSLVVPAIKVSSASLQYQVDKWTDPSFIKLLKL